MDMNKFQVIDAKMEYDQENGYVGTVAFQFANHKYPYEVTLYSKKGKQWMYGLHFMREPGNEEDLLAMEEFIEEHDEYYDFLIETAKKTLQK
jgi:hypothetical protein